MNTLGIVVAQLARRPLQTVLAVVLLALGVATLTFIVLSPMKRLDTWLRCERKATLVVYGSRSDIPDLSNVLVVGQRYEIRNVQDIFGAAVVSGTYGGGSVSIPMGGVTPPQPIGGSPNSPIRTGPDFDVFVVTPVP